MRLIDPQVVELIGISGLGKTQDAGSLRRRTCAIYSLIISNENRQSAIYTGQDNMCMDGSVDQLAMCSVVVGS